MDATTSANHRVWKPDLSDALVLSNGAAVVKGSYKLSSPNASNPRGFGRAANSVGVIAPLGIPFSIKGMRDDIKVAIATGSARKRAESITSVFAGVGDVADAAGTFALGLESATQGTAAGAAIAEHIGWAAPVAAGGAIVFVVFGVAAKSISLGRTHGTVKALDAITKGENAEAVAKAKAALQIEENSGLSDHAVHVIAGMHSLATHKDSYFKTHFMSRDADKVRSELSRRAAQILTAKDDQAQAEAVERAEEAIQNLKKRAKRKMKMDVLSIANMIVALAAVIVLAFTAATPVGWALYTLVALVAIGIFAHNWVYSRRAKEL